MQDAASKHIIRHGERHPFARLTDKQVEWAREQRKDGMAINAIAAIVGCSPHHLSDIVNGRKRKKMTHEPQKGHENIATTQRYLHPTVDDLGAAVDKLDDE